jgi:hypothetical protein
MFVNLVNHATNPEITDDWLRRVAQAVTQQTQRDFCPIYGLAAWSLSYDPKCPYAGSPTLALFDDADQAGALGYHSLDPNGMPYAKVFVNDCLHYGGSLDDGANSVSVTISHEMLEMVGDLAADRFRFDLFGNARAEEACDAVEDTSYKIYGISVSNFVTPSWYLDNGRAPFDHLGVLRRPQSRTDGGYIILMRGGVPATDPPHAAARPSKQHPASRTYRRLQGATAA